MPCARGRRLSVLFPARWNCSRHFRQKRSLSQGVVTGNFEVTAQIKLEAAGLHSYLCRGAYASDSSIVLTCLKLLRSVGSSGLESLLRLEQCVIIGDTPKDLDAARQNDMKCILVGTGRYPVEELQILEPGCLFVRSDSIRGK